MEKHVIMISREWGPAVPIMVNVTDLGVGVSTPLVEFLVALAAELGTPADAERLSRAAQTVIAKMKASTSALM
jgi:hypothetical protein